MPAQRHAGRVPRTTRHVYACERQGSGGRFNYPQLSETKRKQTNILPMKICSFAINLSSLNYSIISTSHHSAKIIKTARIIMWPPYPLQNQIRLFLLSLWHTVPLLYFLVQESANQNHRHRYTLGLQSNSGYLLYF